MNKTYKKIIFAEGMPDSVITAVEQHQSIIEPALKTLCEKANATEQDKLPDFVKAIIKQMNGYLSITEIAFKSQDLISVWKKLDEKSSNACFQFTTDFMDIENSFEGVTGLIHKHRNELKHARDIHQKSQELLNNIKDYEALYYGHFCSDKMAALTEALETFTPQINSEILEFETKEVKDYQCNLWPITREFESDNAKTIYFIRKINLLFLEHFKKPMHSINASIINTLFETEYDEYNVAKIVQNTKNLKTDSL